MAKLYAYGFDGNSGTFSAAEVDAGETEKQYMIDRNGKPLPFLSKYKITKSEMEKVINVSDGVVVYLTERDGLKARQIILDHYKELHDYYKNHMEKYQSYIDNLTGRNADA